MGGCRVYAVSAVSNRGLRLPNFFLTKLQNPQALAGSIPAVHPTSPQQTGRADHVASGPRSDRSPPHLRPVPTNRLQRCAGSPLLPGIAAAPVEDCVDVAEGDTATSQFHTTNAVEFAKTAIGCMSGINISLLSPCTFSIKQTDTIFT